MQPPSQGGVPPPFRGPQDQQGWPRGPSQRPMQQQPGGPGVGGPVNAAQRSGPPVGSIGGPGGPPSGGPSMRPMGSMTGAPGGTRQGPRPGLGGPQGSFGGPMAGPSGSQMGGPPGGPMGGPPAGSSGGTMGGPPGAPMRGPAGGPMGGPSMGPMRGPPGGPMGAPPGGPMGGPPAGPMGGPPGGPMGGPGGMRPGGPPGTGRPMQLQMGGPGGPSNMQGRAPSGGPMGSPPMQMMRNSPGQLEGSQRPMGGGGGTGGPTDMRAPVQGGPVPGYGPGGVQPGKPMMGSIAQGKLPQPSPMKPAQAATSKNAWYRPSRRNRGHVDGGETDKEVEEQLTAKGGLSTFKNLVVLSDNGELGNWSGFQWKGRRVSGITFSKIAHDPEGRLWSINENWEVGRLTNSGFKSLGLLGNEYLVDLAFNPVDGSLWAVNRIGELLRWSGYSLERKTQHGFHKLRGITFDRKGNLWALNTACELAVWNDRDEEWDVKDVPGSLRMTDLAFDERNRLWIIGPEGQLMLLSGSKWVNFGFVGCWKIKDLTFKVLKVSSPSSPAAKAE